MPGRLIVRAPAKINLGLAVLGLRSDGYHNIVSVFQAIDWQDTLEMSSAGQSIELSCGMDGVPADHRNLVWRAVALARQEYDVQQGVCIDLHKGIPAGAGLGGGSSDAAAALRGVKNLFNLPGSEDNWLALCARIGSDVPFFWRGGTARVEGRGERVVPLGLTERIWFVVAVPRVHVSTAWAYASLPGTLPEPGSFVERVDALQSGAISLLDFSRDIPNDFESVVEAVHPEIGRLRKHLLREGAVNARMSGSGSAVFGVFARQCDAERALLSLPENVRAQCCEALPPSDWSSSD